MNVIQKLIGINGHLDFLLCKATGDKKKDLSPAVQRFVTVSDKLSDKYDVYDSRESWWKISEARRS